MRWSALLMIVACTLVVGCNEPEETIPTIMPSSGTTSSGTTSSGTTSSGMTDSAMGHDAHASHSAPTGESQIRFVADKSLHVDNMMCPYSCWPRVKETLASQPGVEAVQLAEQPADTEEGTIALPVVELKLNGDFDFEAALAELAKIDFPAKAVN